jgi:hypothetical protein
MHALLLHDAANEKETAAETERGTAVENARETKGGMIVGIRTGMEGMAEKETMIDGNATRALTEDEIVRGTEAGNGVGQALNTLTTSALRRLRLLRLRGGIRRICTQTDKGGIDHRMLVGRMVAGGVSIWRGAFAVLNYWIIH